MAVQQRIAVLFPGQGILDLGALKKYRSACPELVSMLAAVDHVGRELCQTGVRDALSESGGSPATDLFIYVAAVAAYKRLERLEVDPHVLVGHGFGEIAALVAAGAFSIAEGAEIVAHRFMCLSATRRRAMASIKAPAAIATDLIQLVKEEPLSIAAENSSRETILVGSERALAAAAAIGSALGIPVHRIRSISSPHRPVVGLCAEMVGRLGHIRQHRLARNVFSSLNQRCFSDTDDLIGCVARQLVEPLRFADSVRRLVGAAVAPFVECGPLHGLAANLDCASITDDALVADVQERGRPGVHPESDFREVELHVGS